MSEPSEHIAHNASFQTFLNCYLREIDAGVWHSVDEWHQQTGLRFSGDECYVLELQLEKLHMTLSIGVSFRSLVGKHRFTSVYQQQQNQFFWQGIDTLSTLLQLVNHIYADKPDDSSQIFAPHIAAASEGKSAIKSQKLELLVRMIESHQVMSHYIKHRQNDPLIHGSRFIESEQSLLLGHWLHPTPKSRQGIHSWQHSFYTPELCGKFQLHYFAIDKALVHQASILPITAEDIVLGMLNSDDNTLMYETYHDQEKLLLPVHPLQAQWLLHQEYIQQLLQNNTLIDVGLLGPYFTPTSSVRTLYSDQCDYMVKLSIPVKITNSLRITMQHELDAGLLVAQALRKSTFFQENTCFQMIDDPAYMTVNLPDMTESGFELIIRDNPFSTLKKNTATASVHSIAALVQEPLQTSTQSRLSCLIHELSLSENKSLEAVSLQWFDCYWKCAIESAIKLYDTQGIALEAHQQNSLLDVSHGYPTCYYYRDNQGFYLSETLRTKILQLEPDLIKTKDLFYDDSMICQRFAYYLFVNQLFSVINRFALDGLLLETVLLEHSKKKLVALLPEMKSVGTYFIESILEQQKIPCKANLLTRVDDVDELQAELELAVYTSIVNPLHCQSVDSKTWSSITSPMANAIVHPISGSTVTAIDTEVTHGVA